MYKEEFIFNSDCDSGLKCENSICIRDCTNNNEKPYKTNESSWSYKTIDSLKEKYCYFRNEFENEN